MSTLLALLYHELRLHWRKNGNALCVLAFFVIAVTFFPLSIGPEEEILARIATGIVWVCMMLASLLPLPAMFEKDAEDGTLDQHMLLPFALEWVVMVKMLAHWCTYLLPMVLLSPLLGMMLFMPDTQWLPLALSVLTGSLSLTALGSIAAALMVKNRRAGLITAIILLPLYIPILITGASVTVRTEAITSPIELYILSGFALIFLPVSIWLSTKLLRYAAEE